LRKINKKAWQLKLVPLNKSLRTNGTPRGLCYNDEFEFHREVTALVELFM